MWSTSVGQSSIVSDIWIFLFRSSSNQPIRLEHFDLWCQLLPVSVFIKVYPLYLCWSSPFKDSLGLKFQKIIPKFILWDLHFLFRIESRKETGSLLPKVSCSRNHQTDYVYSDEYNDYSLSDDHESTKFQVTESQSPFLFLFYIVLYVRTSSTVMRRWQRNRYRGIFYLCILSHKFLIKCIHIKKNESNRNKSQQRWHLNWLMLKTSHASPG